MEISQDQVLEEGDYINVQRQSLYDNHTLVLCCTAALNAWDGIEEVEKKIESFTMVIQSPKETFMDFLPRLTSAINRTILNSVVTQTRIQSLGFENANAQCKGIIRTLKVRPAALEKWI